MREQWVFLAYFLQIGPLCLDSWKIFQLTCTLAATSHDHMLNVHMCSVDNGL